MRKIGGKEHNEQEGADEQKERANSNAELIHGVIVPKGIIIVAVCAPKKVYA